MATFILPSKLVAERITVWFPFQAELSILETISTWGVVVETLVGIDPEPELLLYGVAALDGQEVSQQIEAGIPGVIYQLRCTITTNLGQTVQHLAKLAILPSEELIPDLLATVYTTKLYPIELMDSIDHEQSFQEGRLREMPFPVESITAGFVPVGGELAGGLQSYSLHEDMQHDFVPVSGTLEDKLIEYELVESFQHDMNFVNGTLEVKLISYTLQPESIQHGLVFVSGTLV